MRRLVPTILVVLLVLSACRAERTSGRQTPEEAAERIRELDRRWVSLVEEGDAEAIAKLYAEDGSVLPPGSGPVVGRDGIAELWGELVQLPSLTFGPDTIVVSRSVDMAYETGWVEAEMPAAEGATRTLRGKYVVVWEKRDGEWKVIADIYNFDETP